MALGALVVTQHILSNYGNQPLFWFYNTVHMQEEACLSLSVLGCLAFVHPFRMRAGLHCGSLRTEKQDTYTVVK